MNTNFEMKNDAFSDIYMLFCGKEEYPSSHMFGPAIRNCHILYCCLDGKGTYCTDNHTYTIKKGDVFLVNPDEVVFYQADKKKPWTLAWFGFNGSKVAYFLKSIGIDHMYMVTLCKHLEEIDSIIHDVQKHSTLTYHNEIYTHSKLLQFFAYLADSAQVPYTSQIQEENIYINKTIEYIQHNYQNMITIQEIADYVGLHRSYLSTIFANQIHMSLQQFLLHFRIQKAMKLLKETDISIATVANSCGYTNQLTFSKAFHKIAQISPSEYRKSKQT